VGIVTAERVVRAVACLGCGCVCDDIEVVARDGRIVEARNACALGRTWFGDGVVPARARVGEHDVDVREAIRTAARLLTGSERPLVYLAPELSCEAQREAIAIGDWLHALVDSVTSSTVRRSLLAAQERGQAGATLGEIRNRADTLVFWGVDPAVRYPRFGSRYAPDPAGLHVPNGRRSRTIVSVDVGERRGPADADLRLALRDSDEVATLTALAALVSSSTQAADAADAPWAHARVLGPALTAGKYVALVADAEPDDVDSTLGGRDPGAASSLIALAQALNDLTRAALLMLRAGGNRSGADSVMTSQTGYPMAVDFSRGVPRYVPYDAASNRLARRECDVVLLAGSAQLAPAELLADLDVPCALVGPRATRSALASRGVAIDTAIAGIHEAGTAMRMDDVSLPLRPSLAGPRLTASVLRDLRLEIASAYR
jgi:formylmethanofuran dehydrogenase subunit B